MVGVHGPLTRGGLDVLGPWVGPLKRPDLGAWERQDIVFLQEAQQVVVELGAGVACVHQGLGRQAPSLLQLPKRFGLHVLCGMGHLGQGVQAVGHQSPAPNKKGLPNALGVHGETHLTHPRPQGLKALKSEKALLAHPHLIGQVPTEVAQPPDGVRPVPAETRLKRHGLPREHRIELGGKALGRGH